MSKNVAIFWPGDYRAKPNEWALPHAQQTTAQLEAALRKLGRSPYRVEGFLTRPDQAITKLGPINDPMIGVFVHWTYAPHTVDGVIGKDNPLLLASNFSGTWPGLVALLNTGASLESVGRPSSRLWTDAADWTADPTFMERLDQWCSSPATSPTAPTRSTTSRRHQPPKQATAQNVHRRPSATAASSPSMLGDTSMGMINGYFGPRLLHKVGFTEHKVDQAWLVDRCPQIDNNRVEAAFQFVQEKGVTFHWDEADAADFTPEATREQLRGYLAVLDLLDEFQADCLGWQYQLGLLNLLPPSDFAEGLLNSHARPESNGHAIMCSTEADQGNLIPMELMKRILEAKGEPGAVMFHDVRWGARARRPLPLGAPELGKLLRLRLQPRRRLASRASTPTASPPATSPSPAAPSPASPCPAPSPGPAPGSTPTASSSWTSAAASRSNCPNNVREAWWQGTTRQWPFMAADLGCSVETLMAHYMSNHIAVAYGDIFGEMAALSQALGFKLRILSNQNTVVNACHLTYS